MTNIRIKEVEVYHPEYVVNSKKYVDYFKEHKGKDITNLLEALGRKEYYQINSSEENSLTMAIEVSKRVLEKAGMDGKDIDMIIFSSQVPELTVPTNAIFVHEAIQGKKDCIVYDSNANCAGMMIAVEQASRYMLSSPHVNNALIVGSDYLSLVANPEEEITYANFGDAAAAVLLEKTELETGFIDAIYETDSSFKDNILFPNKGFSHFALNKESLGYIHWKPFDGAVSLPYTFEKIEKLLDRNHLQIEDVNAFCFSQFALSNIKRLQERFNLPEEKIAYVGDKYGYTGTSSPFVSLYEGIQSNRIQRGDIVLFWTIGGGHEFIAMLFKY
ncbi:MAG: ketoacyl-ACP synthase III [Lysinibacillus sp.]|nr:ketoacyl-ACP synthase III [Lysinibacillus sp.]